MSRKLTHEEFLNKFYEKNKHAQDIEILGTYINAHTKIKCKCKKCGYEWSVSPNNLLKGTGCPQCACNVRKLTHEEFINRLQQINPDIEVLETYINSKTNIKCRCKVCDHEWTTKPNDLLQGQGCLKCGYKRIAQKMTNTHEEFMKKFNKQNKHAQDIEIQGIYINAHTKMKCRCKIDGYEWEVKPNGLLNGHGCPKCGGTVKLTHEEFINRLQQVNSDIEILRTYKNNKTKIKCKCKVCGHEWEVIPKSLLNGHGCPKCSTSKGEKRITQYLDNLRINYIYDKPYFNDLVSVNGRPLKPDFIIPSLKIWIEYDGIQHYKPTDFRGAMSEQQIQGQFKKVQQNDQIKNQYAEDNNWTLIRIPYTEYDNIEQILDSYLDKKF